MAENLKLPDFFPWISRTGLKELRWFIFLSISAGICEEIIFRLFLFEFLKEQAGRAPAFIAANLVFLLTHIGSGKQNLISSFLLGLIFSAIYYFTKSIWIAMILHASIDINAGILGYRINQVIVRQKNGSLPAAM